MCPCPGEIHEYLKKKFDLRGPPPTSDDPNKGGESVFMFCWPCLAVHTRPRETNHGIVGNSWSSLDAYSSVTTLG